MNNALGTVLLWLSIPKPQIIFLFCDMTLCILVRLRGKADFRSTWIQMSVLPAKTEVNLGRSLNITRTLAISCHHYIYINNMKQSVTCKWRVGAQQILIVMNCPSVSPPWMHRWSRHSPVHFILVDLVDSAWLCGQSRHGDKRNIFLPSLSLFLFSSHTQASQLYIVPPCWVCCPI